MPTVITCDIVRPLVNAGNLDGGNTSVMMYNGEYANYPVSMYNSRNLPSVILVKGEE